MHKHVLPFLGVSEDVFPGSICIVMPWMENGRIVDYIRKLYNEGRLRGSAYSAAVNKWVSAHVTFLFR